MNKEFKYQLDISSRKFKCPSCGKKRFVRYINTQTNQYLSEEYGRCDREINCGYFKFPDKNSNNELKSVSKNKILKPSYFEYSFMLKTLHAYDKNNLILYLLQTFNSEQVKNLIEKYFIGTSKHWKGSTIFWQIDTAGKIRSGKIMLYDQHTGKRVKRPKNFITWVHKIMDFENFNLSQCFFGEHLISESNNTIAIVESEKTAIISSIYFPEYTWIATGSLNGLSFSKFKTLEGRSVILFPDLNSYQIWLNRAKALKKEFPSTLIKVSDLLEKNAIESDKHEGFDIADYLIKYSVKEFHIEKQKIYKGKNKPYQTVGEIFDYYKARGYDKLPDNVKINSGRWKAQ
jgi:predicted RNA-binding Zn-ribbon protein involved in translation (DUF1610 family)